MLPDHRVARRIINRQPDRTRDPSDEKSIELTDTVTLRPASDRLIEYTTVHVSYLR
jgi:hypothetical protein